MVSKNIKFSVEWDWKTWGFGLGISTNPIRTYHFGLEFGPFALWVK